MAVTLRFPEWEATIGKAGRQPAQAWLLLLDKPTGEANQAHQSGPQQVSCCGQGDEGYGGRRIIHLNGDAVERAVRLTLSVRKREDQFIAGADSDSCP